MMCCFPSGVRSGEELIQAECVRHRFGRRRVIARQHDDPQAHAAKLLDRGRRPKV